MGEEQERNCMVLCCQLRLNYNTYKEKTIGDPIKLSDRKFKTNERQYCF